MVLKAKVTKEKDKNESFVQQKKYGIKDGQYGCWEMKGDTFVFVPKGSAVYISQIINRIDTGEKILMLYFYDAQGNRVDVPFPRKELTEQGIMALLSYGAQILKQDAKILIVSIMNQETDAPCILQHEKLGFSQYDNHTIFLGKEAIGAESVYSGKLQIGTAGSYEKWKEMVMEEVLGNIPLEFMLAVAGCGVLTDYLRDTVQVENIVVSIVGESSTGKSTAGLFLVSCGAKPSLQGDSLVFNFSDTQNALMATIPSSFPVLIDEGSLITYNPTSLLYNIAAGKEKKRLTKELQTAESAYFSTVIAITSEKSLLNMADENTGLLVRILEIENEVWTNDAQSADAIKNTVCNNYGWLIPKLAEVILEYEEDDIISMYWEWHDSLVEHAKEMDFYNNLTERACKQYALIMLSASLIEYVMDIELHTDEIIEFIEKHSPVRDTDKAYIGSRALIYLMQYIAEYYKYFVKEDDDENEYSNQKCLGSIKNICPPRRLINGGVYSKRLYISDVTLEEILSEGNFPNKKVILKTWREEGILKCEKDRFLSDIVVTGGLKIKGYIINLPDTDEE
ncbi:MAG: DUF927 domain-containing protein [Eubacterium sp.]|nr:DUF927 domain-containing protein [Eubacterium sp.]